MGSIDPVFLDKKFSVARYMLRYVVGASTDELRFQQLHKVKQYRAIADTEIEGVIDENFANFNTSLARFASISAQLQGACRYLAIYQSIDRSALWPR
jgi:exocyst complex component 4